MTLLGLSLRQWLVAAGALLGVGVTLVILVAVSGIYNVAATSGHAPLVEPFLRMAMRRSVALHSFGVETPDAMSPERVALGAAHFHVGCGNCHGYPGGHDNPIYEQMLPRPPTLSVAVESFDDDELFWIVRHGLKYAGMPAWAGDQRDDEVWSIVAFLRRLPELDLDRYRALAQGNAPLRPVRPDEVPVEGATALRLTACARCHDTENAPPTSSYVPRLGGQSERYLEAALHQFRDGARHSGFMEPVAVDLDDDEIAALARYYAGLESPVAAGVPAGSGDGRENGRRIAREGVPERDVPACDACHGPHRLPVYPRLAGQPADYQVAQLELWQRGGRSGTDVGRLMAVIALRLQPDEIEAVAAYYSEQDPGSLAPADAGDDN